ncbi:MAG: N-acetylmuramoyl-L-alanine amidase [Bacteroidales bacterium]|nr:N-acetylmuramoyl-L-alanine amidase [Bacteroidales bacterium]MBN2755736.1 N-acetylmuramoyl-L-alanine amidase [Bacteroidales bacterium]
MEIKDHFILGENIKKFVKSPNHSGNFETGLPDTVVLHYTAGPFKPALNTLTNPRVKASAHLIVDRDGSITQLIPFNLIAWHAGKSSYGNRTGMNKFSLGIEMVNSGPLTQSGNVYRSWFGSAFNPSDVIEATHRNETKPKFWHTYTEEQIQTVSDICRLLIDVYDIKFILGHEEIAPLRKTDPGPAFPLDRLRSKLLMEDRQSEDAAEMPVEGRIAANSLNIRLTPTPEGKRIARPLQKGAKVKILDKSNGWYKVSTEVEGWVFGKYVESI